MDVQQIGRHAGEVNPLPQVDNGCPCCVGALGEFGDACKTGLGIVGACHQGALQVDDEQRGIWHVSQPIRRLRHCVTPVPNAAMTLLCASTAASGGAWTS